MKILAINSSHRGDKGYTRFLIDTFFDGAQKHGAECETVVLKNHRINICLGCRVCHKKEHYLTCVYDGKDDVQSIFNKMREADILVFATPVYIFTMTGLMKVFLDRITSTADSSIMSLSENGLFFHHIDKKLASKPFVLLTTQDNIENETSKNIETYFKTFSDFMDAPFIGYIRRKSGGLVGHGIDKEKELRYPKIVKVYEYIEKAGGEVAKYGHIRKQTQKQCNANIVNMPKFIEIILGFRFIRKNKAFMTKILNKIKNSTQTHHTL